MAGTSDKCFTMQGLGTPISASGQSEKAGSQVSSSSDCSSSLVDNLASEEFHITRSVSHICNKSSDLFCYVCGEFEVVKNRRPFSDKMKKVYEDCFGIQITNWKATWVPHTACNRCYTMLLRWEQSRDQKCLKFIKPMIWSAPTNQKNCYFCLTCITGFTSTTKHKIHYANVPSIVKPEKILIVEETAAPEPMNEDEEMQVDEDSEENYPEDEEYLPDVVGESKIPETFNQLELNDLVRDLGLSKVEAEHFASALKKKNLLAKDTTAYFYRNREKEFRKFFTKDSQNSLVYCSDVKGLLDELKPNTYKDDEWRLFIDSSKRSLKAVILNNGNNLAPIPVAHSTKLKETYDNLQIVLEKMKYSEHQWRVCGDLKIATLLLGQQSGFTKYPCFLCLFDSRDRKNHYVKKEWPTRASLDPGSHNVIRAPLIDSSKYLLPPLHIKLGLMKQFVKALEKDGNCFKYLGEKFPAISDAKLKEGIFDGPQIRTLFQDDNFVYEMNDIERTAWCSFKDVSQNFLGNKKSEDYVNLVEDLLYSYDTLGCLINLKLHYLHSHLSHFPENLGEYSEEQGERFHQDISVMEKRYQGKWDVNMMADYCWTQKRDLPEEIRKRKRNPLRRSFQDKRVRYKRRSN